MKTNYILVTGGAGFIGSHLCEQLIERGSNVLCLDSLDKYYDPKIKRKNLASLLKQRRFKFVRGDIRNASLVMGLFKGYKFNLVIHLAAKAGVRASIEKPQEYADVNLIGTTSLLEACRQYNVKKFVFASSSSVYGATRRIPFIETDDSIRPLSPYGVTKKAGESLCYAYHYLYGINIACLRFFSVYGPRQRPDLAINKFTRLILNNKPIVLFGDGRSKRDYTYIDDILGGILKTIRLIKDDKKPLFRIINLGSSRPIELSALIGQLGRALRKKPMVRKAKKPLCELDQTYANISYAEKILSYKPATTIGAGIKKYLEWYRAGGVKIIDEK
jgi:UDP-glucuronate 4-epimerase